MGTSQENCIAIHHGFAHKNLLCIKRIFVKIWEAKENANGQKKRLTVNCLKNAG